MGGLSALLGLAVVGGMFVAAAAVLWFILKVFIVIILLPFRLLLWLVALPLFLVKVILLGVGGLLLGLLFAAGSVIAVIGLTALLVPLLPIVLLLALTWVLVRSMKRPVPS